MNDLPLLFSQNGTALTHTPPSAYRAAYHAAALHGQPALFRTVHLHKLTLLQPHRKFEFPCCMHEESEREKRGMRSLSFSLL